MSDSKLHDLTGLTTLAALDEIYVVDVSDTTDSTDGTSKKYAVGITSGFVGVDDTQTLTNKTLTAPTITTPTITAASIVATAVQINDTTADHQYILAVNELTADRTITLPLLTGNDDFVFEDHIQTITNKNIVQKVTSYTPDAAGTATLDVSIGAIHSITMPAGNITIAISNEAVGKCFMVEITQDDVGSRTVTWFTTIRWMDGTAPTLTTTASKTDVFGFRVTGTDTYFGYIIGQNL